MDSSELMIATQGANMHTFKGVRLLMLVIGTLALPAPCQPQNQGDTTLTEQTITKTPSIRALCLPSMGNSNSYGDSMTRLVKYTNVNSIKTEGFVFSDNWKPGADPNDPGLGASWEVCVESSDTHIVAVDPFIFRDLEPEEAGYGLCVGSPVDLSACFRDLETFVLAKQYHPAAPPRYKIKDAENSSKKIAYQIWLPVTFANPEAMKTGSEKR